MKPMITIKMVWLTKHEKGGEDEDRVAGGQAQEQDVERARHCWPEK